MNLLAHIEALCSPAEPEVGIAKIISGGQTGVDIGGLRAAKAKRVPTGGTIAKGCLTQNGPKPEWAAEFGLVECEKPGYPPRTRKNVADADVTVRIAVNFLSAGEVCTMKAVRKFDKPCVDIPVRRGFYVDESDIFAAAEAIVSLSKLLGRAVVVNVAGNSEKTAPGIEAFAEGVVKYLIDAVDACIAEVA